MQWFAVFFWCLRVASLLAVPEKTWRGKRTIPQRGGWRVGQNFYGCQDFLLLPLNVKNLANFGNIWKTLFNVVSLHKKNKYATDKHSYQALQGHFERGSQ